MTTSHLHILQSGENLSTVARRYGILDWREIYFAPSNNSLRMKRLDPNKVKSGDMIMIPPDKSLVLQESIEKLKKIRLEFVTTNDQILKEWQMEYTKVKKTSQTADTIATVATVLVHVGGMAAKGISACKLTGAELARVNSQLTRDTLKLAYVEPAKITLEHTKALEGNNEDGSIWGFTKKAAKFLLIDISSPSWWASTVSGINIDKINAEIQNQIKVNQEETLKNLDEKIRKTERELELLKANR